METNEEKQKNHESNCLMQLKNNFIQSNCFGLHYTEFDPLKEKISLATPNPKSNDFPDFIFPGGFIEHFQVTSSKEHHKKGSPHKIAEHKFNKKNDEIENLLKDKFNFVTNSLKYSGHNYSNLVHSFKKNWSKHLNSLNDYVGDREIGIFMIEYPDFMALSMAENSLNDVEGFLLGDLKVPQEIINNYRLSRDTFLQDWMFSFSNQISYVVFFNHENIEIINLKTLKELQSVLPYDYVVAPNVTMQTKRWQHLFRIEK